MISDLDVGRSALLTDLSFCVNYYRLFSPGLYVCVLAPVQLDALTRLTPGLLAMVNYGKHKQCSVDEDGNHFVGPPNFVVDVFPSGDWLDYEERRMAFERAGVIEYLAVQDTDPLEYRWNRLANGKLSLVVEDDSGIIRSTALPGLWIAVASLQSRNWWTITGSIAQGVSRQGHHELMDSIWHKSPHAASLSTAATAAEPAYLPPQAAGPPSNRRRW